MPRYRYHRLSAANTCAQAILSRMIEEDKQWGLVIVRCSYESQEKWDAFLSTIKARVLYQIKSRDVRLPDIIGPDIYETLAMTFIEDRNTLHGADIKTSTDKFVEWLRTDGLDEMKEHRLQNPYRRNLNIEHLENGEFLRNLPDITSQRYQYYIHASKESIESYSIDLQTVGPIDDEDCSMDMYWKGGDNFWQVVSSSSLLSELEWKEQHRREAAERGDEEEEDSDDEQGYISKKVRGETLLDLYVKLLSSFDYFHDHKEEGFWVLP